MGFTSIDLYPSPVAYHDMFDSKMSEMRIGAELTGLLT